MKYLIQKIIRRILHQLPRDEEGFVQCSASYGQHFMVVITYNTDSDGKWVGMDDDSNKTFHGPMTEAEARDWVIDYPDDTDIQNMEIWVLNKVRP